jgi:hypothetical protein
MKMKSLDIPKIVKEYVKAAGYSECVEDSVIPEEPLGRWKINVTALHSINNSYSKKLLSLDDTTQEIIEFSDVYRIAPQKKSDIQPVDAKKEEIAEALNFGLKPKEVKK